MVDNARRCALPGCDEVIEDIPGRPPRRYCTAAHRSAARQARRAAAQLDQDARLAATLPWLAEPAEEPALTEPTRATERRRRPRRPADRAVARPRPVVEEDAPPAPRRWRLGGSWPVDPKERDGARWRRRRTVAVFSAAGILAGGYAVTASEPVPQLSGPALVAPEPGARRSGSPARRSC
ncbi:hypothetical protein BJF78_24095 [Pseudonocardia sp. CNS-139]|nr:hypothetical protein BJF78_24095 [Pseudonocardia sp. CNS-139]